MSKSKEFDNEIWCACIYANAYMYVKIVRQKIKAYITSEHLEYSSNFK